MMKKELGLVFWLDISEYHRESQRQSYAPVPAGSVYH